MATTERSCEYFKLSTTMASMRPNNSALIIDVPSDVKHATSAHQAALLGRGVVRRKSEADSTATNSALGAPLYDTTAWAACQLDEMHAVSWGER
jgi:hypothetical protein